MTIERILNIRILSAVALFVAVLTVLIAVAAPAQHVRGLSTAPAVSTRENSGSATVTTSLFLPPVAYDSGGYVASFVALGDVNGDGKLDLVLGNQCVSSVSTGCPPNGAAVGVLLGNGDGTFHTAVTYGTGGNSGPFWPVSIAITDVNGDHKPDLVVANGGSNAVGVLLGNGDGTFQPAVAYGSGDFFPVSVAVTDLNGDGNPDIVVANECGSVVCGGSVGVLLGNGDGTFRDVVTYSAGGLAALSVAVAGVNGDGRPDLLVAGGCDSLNLCGTKESVAVLLGNGDGTFQAATKYFSGGSAPYSLKVADLNGDGKLDLVVANSVSATVGVLLGKGDGTFRAAVTYSSGEKANVAQSSSVAVADVNGDGHPDLLLTTEYMGSNGNNGGAISVLLGNGDGTFQTAVEYASGGYQTLGVAVGDVNGDGRPDALIANGYSQINGGPGTVTVLLNNTTGGQSKTSTTLVSGLNPSLVGQAVTFTATVSSTFGSPPNGELITFKNGSSVLGTAPLSAGIAALTTSSLAAGIFTITAAYGGDTNFTASTSPGLRQVVNSTTKSATSTTLSSSLNPSIYGQSVTWKATVTTSGPVPPTGTVTFSWNTSTIGTATLNASGVATFTKSNLNAFTYPLVAAYKGDASNLASTSTILSQVVKQAISSATLTSSPNPSTQGQAVTFTAKITSPTVVPTGPVTFKVGNTVLGTAQLSAGKATFTTSTLPVGSTIVTATYPWNSNIAASSASVTQTVGQ